MSRNKISLSEFKARLPVEQVVEEQRTIPTGAMLVKDWTLVRDAINAVTLNVGFPNLALAIMLASAGLVYREAEYVRSIPEDERKRPFTVNPITRALQVLADGAFRGEHLNLLRYWRNVRGVKARFTDGAPVMLGGDDFVTCSLKDAQTVEDILAKAEMSLDDGVLKALQEAKSLDEAALIKDSQKRMRREVPCPGLFAASEIFSTSTREYILGGVIPWFAVNMIKTGLVDWLRILNDQTQDIKELLDKEESFNHNDVIEASERLLECLVINQQERGKKAKARTKEGNVSTESDEAHAPVADKKKKKKKKKASSSASIEDACKCRELSPEFDGVEVEFGIPLFKVDEALIMETYAPFDVRQLRENRFYPGVKWRIVAEDIRHVHDFNNAEGCEMHVIAPICDDGVTVDISNLKVVMTSEWQEFFAVIRQDDDEEEVVEEANGNVASDEEVTA